MSNFKNTKKERARFETLLKLLDTATNNEIKVAIMAFINSFVNSPEDFDLRINLRKELYALGFKDIFLVSIIHHH
jgi:Flp pilus assembly protein TadD